MNTERIDPQASDAPEAVVTYSRLPSRGAGRQRGGLSVVERVEPVLDAAEIPLTDPHDDGDPGYPTAPELRAHPLDSDRIAGGNRRRRGPARVVIFGAAVAILAGVGALAAAVGIATIVPGERSAGSAPTSAPAVELASRAPQAAPVAPAPAKVREIPLSVDREASAAEPAVAPPVPRPRPDVVPENVAARADAGATDSQPAEPAMGETIPSATAAGTDTLITDIEDTLARIDSTAPGQAADGAIAPGPPVLPPPAPAPPMMVGTPGYPPVHTDCLPSGGDFDPCYDVMPPAPVTGNGYPVLPVPAEPVPLGASPGLWSGEVEDEPKPGFVRRALSRTANAVTRVFSRDGGGGSDRDRDADSRLRNGGLSSQDSTRSTSTLGSRSSTLGGVLSRD